MSPGALACIHAPKLIGVRDFLVCTCICTFACRAGTGQIHFSNKVNVYIIFRLTSLFTLIICAVLEAVHRRADQTARAAIVGVVDPDADPDGLPGYVNSFSAAIE